MRSRLARPGQGLFADSVRTFAVKPSEEYAEVRVAGAVWRGGLSSHLGKNRWDGGGGAEMGVVREKSERERQEERKKEISKGTKEDEGVREMQTKLKGKKEGKKEKYQSRDEKEGKSKTQTRWPSRPCDIRLTT